MKLSKFIFVFTLLLLSVGCQTLAKRNRHGCDRRQTRSDSQFDGGSCRRSITGKPRRCRGHTRVDGCQRPPATTREKERWLRVKARDEDATEGWIESRNVMPEDVLNEAKKLAEEDKGVPPQPPDN